MRLGSLRFHVKPEPARLGRLEPAGGGGWAQIAFYEVRCKRTVGHPEDCFSGDKPGFSGNKLGYPVLLSSAVANAKALKQTGPGGGISSSRQLNPRRGKRKSEE